MKLLIVGASARAAVTSASRASIEVFAADRFGDLDLRAVCPHHLIPSFPQGVPAAFAQFPDASNWLYTGPLENYPRLVQRFAKLRPLLGNGASVLRRVRNPFRLGQSLGTAQIPMLEVHPGPIPPRRGRWLRKQIRSGGGLSVTEWLGPKAAGSHATRSPRAYFQAYCPGPAVGAVFIGSGGRAVLIGVTQQLIGEKWCGSRGFQYCGSIGPTPIESQARQDLTEIGERLSQDFHLQGLFCVDAILHRDRAWLVEVNPRYSASVEILERAGGGSLLPAHIAACLHGQLPNQAWQPQAIHGKAIAFAETDTTAPRWADTEWTEETLADIPPPGCPIRQGQPIATVFANGITQEAVEQRLRARVSRLRNTARADDS